MLIKTKALGRVLRYMQSTDSTQHIVKEIAAKEGAASHGTLVLAETQTAGSKRFLIWRKEKLKKEDNDEKKKRGKKKKKTKTKTLVQILQRSLPFVTCIPSS